MNQPRYRQLADQLLGDIRSGRIKVGQSFPGELELMARFSVSRHTVRESLRQLTALGLIERRQGVGTVVRAKQSNEGYVHSIRSPAELLQYPIDSRMSLMGSEEVKANRKLAKLLDCATGARWFKFSVLRRFKTTRVPLCWTDVYVLPEYAGVTKLVARKSQHVYELIEQTYGERITNVHVDLRAESLDADKASALECDAQSPSLTVIRRYVGNERRVFEVSIAWHPAERFTYSIDLRRGWQSADAWSAA
jgi:GntR family transcriptional regulator